MHRQEKLKNYLMELTAKFLEKESGQDALVTVTNCNVSPKFNRADIFITVLPKDKEGEVMQMLEKKLGQLRKYISENLKTKSVPVLKIEIDLGEKNRQRIEELLSSARGETRTRMPYGNRP